MLQCDKFCENVSCSENLYQFYHWILIFVFSIFTLEVFIGSKPEYNLKSLRAIRVLRPLKLISGIPSRFISFEL